MGLFAFKWFSRSDFSFAIIDYSMVSFRFVLQFNFEFKKHGVFKVQLSLLKNIEKNEKEKFFF